MPAEAYRAEQGVPVQCRLVIFVLTAHYQSERWIDPQLEYLRRHMHVPYRVFASLEGISDGFADRFDHTIPSQGDHAGKLNLLASEACAVGEPSDLLVFLDGDAFPISDPMPTVHEAMAESGFLAIHRRENFGDQQPHPSFAATTIETWERIHGDWSPGHTWNDPNGKPQTDVGGNLMRLLELAAMSWTPLLRSNTKDLHPLWFGVYGGIVYHHGAGFRRPVSRADLFVRMPPPPKWKSVAARLPVLRSVARDRMAQRPSVSNVEGVARSAAELSAVVYDQLRSDPCFWHQFMPTERS